MGEVLPPKRQTVVDRLRRRLEIYRRHQGSCLPRYDQAANGIYDAQRHETLLLKQRFLEAKAKKSKRSDNRHAAQRDNNLNNGVANNTNNNAGSNNCDSKTIVTQSKLKRAAGSPLLDCALDGLGDSHPNKIPRNSTPDHPNNSSHHQQQSQQQQTGMPSFSVQIVQQFSSNTSKSPHSQTIQTNVTVQALSGGQIKTSNSPMTTATSSPDVQSSDGGTNILSNNSGTPGAPSTSISVGTSIECKQEPPDNNFAPCSLSNNRPMTNNLNSELVMNSGNNLGTAQAPPPPPPPTLGDRFSDSLANLGFPEDSSDDVIHPDILKDIIDDVFTNPSDLMNGFSFVDNLKDTSGSNIIDDKDSSPNSLRNVLGSNKPMANNNNVSSAPINHFQNNMGSTQFSVNQSQQSVFDFHPSGLNNTANVNVSQSFPQSRMSSYVTTSPNLNSMSNNNGNNGALGLDFKLTEPSPAAQTLKQMAEQHQNMQQKQQQQLGHLHPRSPFASDSFPDPLSNIRSNFLNGSPTSIMQKSPNNIFQSIGFNSPNNNQQQQQQQQQVFPGTTPVKQEVSSPVPPMYTNMNSPPVQLADLEQLHKRRQAMQMQQQQQRPPFSHSPDQKPMGMNQGGGPTSYMATRPLTHYNDPMSMGNVPSHGSASNSPVSHPGQFMRGVSTPGVTPPPPQNFVASPSSGTALHLSQSQQLQITQGQQLQVSQSQQQLLISQDMKPNMSPQAQQQQHVQARNFYPGHLSSVHMSQSQSVSFQFGGNSGACSPNAGQRTQAPPPQAPTTTQRQMQQQYASRPPPDYQSPLDTNSMNMSQQHQPQQAPSLNHQTDSRVVNQGQRGRKNLHVSQPYLVTPNQRDLSIPPHSSTTLLMSRTTPPPPLTVTTGVRGRGGKANSRSIVAMSKQGYPRLQRPPNVNVGPEGLNISQRPPAMSADWRHVFMQQQQQINPNPSVRIPYSRAPMSNTYGQNPGISSFANSGASQMNPNSNVIPSSSGMSRVDHLMTNNMSQISSVPTGNVQFMMQQQQQQQQQQQAMMQNRLGTNSNSLLTTSQMQMTGATVSMPVRDASQQQQQQSVFSNDKKVSTATKLDESSQNIADSNQFILDFLDNIDCSTSDLLNFDMPSGGSSFPLLDDMSKMLGP